MVVAAAAMIAIAFRIHLRPVYQWDEARIAINALEMMGSANPLIVTFSGEPDLYNSRPPLAAWLIAISMSLFGVNEFALRLPTLIAALVTTFAVYGFARRVSGRGTVGVLAALILLGMGGYIEVHVARTADYDALLVLFATLATFSLFTATEAATDERAKRNVYKCGMFLTLAALTKGPAALLSGVGYAAYLLLSDRMRAIAVSKTAALAAAGFLVAIGGFYVVREVSLPGYLAAAWDDQVRVRWTGTGQVDPWHFYLRALIFPWQHRLILSSQDLAYTHSAFPWGLLFPAAAWAGLRSKRGTISRACIFLSLVIAGMIAILSIMTFKIAWYVAPAYPLIAVVVALGIGELACWMRQTADRRLSGLAPLLMPAAFVVASIAICFTVWKNERQIEAAPFAREERLAYFLQQFAKESAQRRPVRVIADGLWTVPVVRGGKLGAEQPYDAAADFYVRQMRRLGADIRLLNSTDQVDLNAVIVGCGRTTRMAFASLRQIGRTGDCFALARDA